MRPLTRAYALLAATFLLASAYALRHREPIDYMAELKLAAAEHGMMVGEYKGRRNAIIHEEKFEFGPQRKTINKRISIVGDSARARFRVYKLKINPPEGDPYESAMIALIDNHPYYEETGRIGNNDPLFIDLEGLIVKCGTIRGQPRNVMDLRGDKLISYPKGPFPSQYRSLCFDLSQQAWEGLQRETSAEKGFLDSLSF